MQIINFGFIFLFFITGKYVFSYSKKKVPVGNITSWILEIASGAVLWALPLLYIGVLGYLKTEYFGIVGWTLLLMYMFRLLLKNKNKIKFKFDFSFIKLPLLEIVFVVGVVLCGAFYVLFPAESFIGGRDEGLYSNHAIYIANHGNLKIDYPVDEDLLHSKAAYTAGMYATTEKITVQFGHLYPVFLAFAYSAFGLMGILLFNSVIAILFIILFRKYLEMFAGPRLSIFFSLLIGFNLGQIWFVRFTLSEITTQFLILLMLFTFYVGMKHESKLYLAVSGMFLGAAILCRVESLLLLAFLLVCEMVYIYLSNNKAKCIRYVYFSAIPYSIIALLYYLYHSRPYFELLQKQIVSMIIFTAILFLCRPLAKYIPNSNKSNKIYYYIISIALVVLFLFAYFIRPHLMPYPVYDLPGISLDGLRNFNERSLLLLSSYLSPVLVFASLLGFIVSLYEVLIKKSTKYILPVIVFLGFSLLYLYDINISPDQFWAARRFIPVIIPGFIFMACISTKLLDTKPSIIKCKTLIITCLVVYLIMFTFNNNKKILTHKEYEGFWNQITEIAQRLPDNAVIVEKDMWQITTPLFLAFDKRIASIQDYSDEEVLDTINQLSNDNEIIYFITPQQEPKILGYKSKVLDEIVVEYPYFDKKLGSLPDQVMSSKQMIVISQLEKVDSKQTEITFGGTQTFGIQEHGLFTQEFQPNGTPFRWTNGAATFTLDNVDDKPTSMRLSLLSVGDLGSNMELRVNNIIVYTGEILAGSFEQEFSLLQIPASSRYEIEINSSTWQPSLVLNNNDIRQLGVAIKELTMIFE